MSDENTKYEGKHLRLINDGGWEYAQRVGVTGVIAVLPITVDHEMIFIEQYRKPIGRNLIEIPAGLVGDGELTDEIIEEAALRELQEETGYTSDELEYLTEGPSSAGMTDEIVTYYLAHHARKIHEGGGTGDEEITMHLIPTEEAMDWLHDRQDEGQMIDPKVYTALYFWLMEQQYEDED